MVDTTYNLELPELEQQALNGHLIHNDSLWLLDIHGQPTIEAILTAQPTALTGRFWLVGVGATGTDWAGHDNEIAHYYDGVWRFYVPKQAWEVTNKADEHRYRFNGATWDKLAIFPCYGEAELDYALRPIATALAIATKTTINGYHLNPYVNKMSVTLTAAENANRATFNPDANYSGTFRALLGVSGTIALNTVLDFFVYDGATYHYMGTSDKTTGTDLGFDFHGSRLVTVSEAQTMEFFIESSVAQTINYQYLDASLERVNTV